MTSDHYLIAYLADLMFESGKDRTERRATGCVFRNQVLGQGLSWYGVVAKQYLGVPNPNSPAFQQCLWDAEDIYYNRLADIVDGASDFFPRHAGQIPHITVGGLRFYKDTPAAIELTTPLPPEVQLDLFTPADLDQPAQTQD